MEPGCRYISFIRVGVPFKAHHACYFPCGHVSHLKALKNLSVPLLPVYGVVRISPALKAWYLSVIPFHLLSPFVDDLDDSVCFILVLDAVFLGQVIDLMHELVYRQFSG